MTTTEPTTGQPGTDELTEDDLARLNQATLELVASRPTFGLLDPEDAIWHGAEEPGRHLISISGVLGLLDVDQRSFTPVLDGEPAMRELLVERLTAVHGATPVPVTEPRYVVAWTSAEVQSEADGTLVVTATAAPLSGGPAAEVRISLDSAFAITDLTPAEDPAEDEASEATEATETAEAATETQAEATGNEAETPEDNDNPIATRSGITADYLSGHYGETPFPYLRRGLVVDWSTWQPDQATPEGLVGSWVEAGTALGGKYRAYAWFDPASGFSLAQADELEPPDLGARLGEHYGESAFPFEGEHFVIDWTTWQVQPTPLDQPFGSALEATGGGGGKYALYAWFDPAAGVEIVRAEQLGAPEPDPSARFHGELVPALRSAWESGGRRLAEAGGRSYDVGGWLDGEYGCELEFTGFREPYYHARLGAVAERDGQQVPVTCELRIQDAGAVWVDAEHDR
ncbi:hypothetical protein [Amycolatopsis magusensis]|uniref:hypothetical protein n=1 Tax=Amycolatopsis magusensis TaxID=882444 RepID=UPI0024A9FDC5|nr:hypothetical protein [Amycolatopsis magusensis]MDI5976125.1 hypothetical protein [Amycolatopsis magusensis]